MTSSVEVVSVWPERQRVPNQVLALCAPLIPLSASISYVPFFSWLGWIATGVSVVAAALSWLWDENRSSLYPTLIGASLGSLLAMGVAFHGLPTQSAYVEAIQLIVLWVLLSHYRTVTGSHPFVLAALFTLGFMILVNFSVESAFELFENGRSWTSPLFSNPSLFGMVFVVLVIFAFMLARMILSRRLKILAYTLCFIAVAFIAVSGSRTSMVAVLAFFAAYVIGTTFHGNRKLLWFGSLLSLGMAPVITLTFLTIIGSPLNFLPKQSSMPDMESAEKQLSSKSSCRPTPYTVCPTTEPLPDVDNRGGGPLAVNKSMRTGREIIWPKVIELAGEAPIKGHGLGSSPAGFMPHPFTGLHPHSGFLQVYYQFGMFGLAVWFLLWIVLFARAINVRDPSSRSVSVAVLCAACALETTEIVFLQTHFGIGAALAILATAEFVPTRAKPDYASARRPMPNSNELRAVGAIGSYLRWAAIDDTNRGSGS
jgi:hypothetical protein